MGGGFKSSLIDFTIRPDIYRYTNTESHHQAFDLYDIYQKNTDEAVKLIDAMFAIIDEISENQLNSYNRHLNKQDKN